MAYHYKIHDISGVENIWVDLLSRWGSPVQTVCAIYEEPRPLSPSLDSNYVWPTMSTIVKAQQAANIKFGQQLDGVYRTESGKIWITDEASELQVRLWVVAHFGIGGHRGVDDVHLFVKQCLHCSATDGTVLRVLGEALYGTKPNDLIHWDYVYTGNSNTWQRYIVVLKDDASKYVWLKAGAEADALTTRELLLDWFASFRICYRWVSDQGSHFKNTVIEDLHHSLGAYHHFTATRCPWANRTVEVVKKELLRAFRAHASEMRIHLRDRSRLAFLVQYVLNQSLSPSFGGEAPVTVMMGMAYCNPAKAIALPSCYFPTMTLQRIQELKALEFAKIRASIFDMYKAMPATRTKKRNAERAHQNGRRGGKMAQFSIGDYVLYTEVWKTKRDKLRVRWCGPATVTASSSNWIFTVHNLITDQECEAHASHLKAYADKDLKVEGDLLAHVSHNSEGHVVEELCACRPNLKSHSHDVLVKCRGLDSSENIWESVTQLHEYVPAAFRAYALGHQTDPVVQAIFSELKIPFGGSVGSGVDPGTL
uniref:Chromodomain protein putative n=1 Tax=Albugo laibachii Nc14 TaxID=890382 RepID=F0WKI0_9STRA|nr:chromodomain protein putative [Albugo laibachii Nc14]|eukprot:CCA21784.1 chromodomain protein putative [Albugo laibachii Nc14]